MSRERHAGGVSILLMVRKFGPPRQTMPIPVFVWPGPRGARLYLWEVSVFIDLRGLALKAAGKLSTAFKFKRRCIVSSYIN